MGGESTSRPQSDDSPQAPNNLPSEILCEIFVHCLPEDSLNHIQPDTNVAPMLLCQVSSHWRCVALGTPGLWAHLYVKLDRWAPSISTSQLLRRGIKTSDIDFLQWWMGNVRSPPSLRLELNAPREDSDMSTPSSTDVQANISDIHVDNGPFFERILTTASGLYLEECFLSVLREYLGGRVLECPALNTLSIHSPLQEDIEKMFSNNNTFSRIPVIPTDQLKCLIVIVDPYYIWDRLPDTEQILWAALTHLSLNYFLFTVNDWHSLIRFCVSLQVGEFSVADNTAMAMEDPFNPRICTPVCLPHLRKLVLISKNHPSHFNPFVNLRLPALKSLKLRIPNITTQRLNSMFQCFPNLKELRVFIEDPFERRAEESTALQMQARILDLPPLLEFLAFDGFESRLESWSPLKQWVEFLMSSDWFDFGDSPPENFEELELRILTWNDARDDATIQALHHAVQSHPDIKKLSLKTIVNAGFQRDWKPSPENLWRWMTPHGWSLSSPYKYTAQLTINFARVISDTTCVAVRLLQTHRNFR